MNLCVVTNTNDDGTNTEFFPDGTHGITYSAFSNPCTLSVANLPLNNIVYCGNQTAAKRSLKITPTDASGATLGSMEYKKMADITPLVPESFKIMDSTGASFVSDKMDFTNDIYFVFTYADELK